MSTNSLKRISLFVEEPSGVSRKRWPVTQGVPFPEGELPRGQAVCVVAEDGTPIPTQHLTLTTWSAERRYVKWLLVDFQVDLKPHERRELFLEYGESIEAVHHIRPTRCA